MIMKGRYAILCVAAFIAGLAAMHMLRDPNPCQKTYSFRTDTIHGDSVPYPVYRDVPYPVPVYRDTGSTRWRDKPIDTGAILREYFTRNYYRDTITDDTSFLAIIEDTVTENRIIYRQYWHQNLRPKVINQYTTTIHSGTGLYLGAGTGITPDKPALNVSALFITTGKFHYQFTYDLNNKSLSGTLFIRFGKSSGGKPG
jgi:hypothetical protein